MGATSSAYRNGGLQMLEAIKKSNDSLTNEPDGFFGPSNPSNLYCDLSMDCKAGMTEDDNERASSPYMVKPSEAFEETMETVRAMAKTEIGDGYDEKVFDKYFHAFYRIAHRAVTDSLNVSVCDCVPTLKYHNNTNSNTNTNTYLNIGGQQEQQYSNENEQECHSDNNEIADKQFHDSSKPQCVDGYRWRKYGEKKTRTTGFVRSYYKCVEKGCYARKILQMKDGVVHHSLTKYFSLPHTHPTNVRRCSTQRKRGKRANTFSNQQSKQLNTVRHSPTEPHNSSSTEETPISVSSSPNIDLNSNTDFVETETTYDDELCDMELFL